MYGERLRCIAPFTKAISRANGFNDDTSDEITEISREVGIETVGLSEG